MGTGRGRKGQSLVEFALVLPVLLLLLLGLLDLGRVWYALVAIRDCAGEGATYAALHPLDEDGIQARAAAASAGLIQVDPQMVSVTYPPQVTPGASITVTVAYTFTFLNPLIGAMVPDSQIVLARAAAAAVIGSP